MGGAIRFDDQVILVTGAGRGLGRAYALAFAARGATLVVHDAGVTPNGDGGDEAVARAVVDEIRDAGGSAVPAYQNLDSAEACRALVAEATSHFGRIDVVVNNAGIVQFDPLADMTPGSFARVFSIGAEAALWVTQAALPWMERQGYGRIVYTVSGHGLRPSGSPTDLIAYGMSKGAVFGLMNMLAGAYPNKDIRVNAISPVAATRVLRRKVGDGEFTPEQVAPGVLYLASRDCTESGVVLAAADGRFSIRTSVGSSGVDYGREPAAPESIREHWSGISS